MRLWCRERALPMTALRGRSTPDPQGRRAPRARWGKLAGSEPSQSIAAARIDLVGPEAIAFFPPPRHGPNPAAAAS